MSRIRPIVAHVESHLSDGASTPPGSQFHELVVGGAGNTTTAGGLTFTYTPDNMMATSTSSSGTWIYWYDGDGVRKYRMAPDGTAYFYINAAGLNTLSEFKMSGGTLTHERDYLYAGSRLLASARLGASGPPPPDLRRGRPFSRTIRSLSSRR